MGKPCTIPTNVVLLLASIICACAAFAGGFIMYLEGLRVIEETVKEVSQADTDLSVQVLKQSFADVLWIASSYVDFLTKWSNFDNLAEMQDFFAQDQWAKTSNSVNVYSLGVLVANLPPPEGMMYDIQTLYQMVWWDPISDPELIKNNSNSNKVWVTAYYTPSEWAAPSCQPDEPEDGVAYPDSAKRCVLAWSVHPETGDIQRNIYNYSDNFINRLTERWQEQQVGWETSGAGWWRGASVWYAEDDTPYMYVPYVSVLPRLYNSRLLRNKKVCTPIYLTFYSWQEKLGAQGSEAIVLALFLDEDINSQVLATNSGTNLMKDGCRRGGAADYKKNPCVVVLRELAPTIQDAATVVLRHPVGDFIREGISGGEHWMRRKVIFKTGPLDDLPTIYLLWVRPTSSVQDKTDRGLHFFIAFLCGLVFFQILVLILLIVKIGAPLSDLAGAMSLIDGLELDIAEERTLGVGQSCCSMSEINSVSNSFLKAIQALRLYKEYLPQSCLPDAVDEEEEEEEEAEKLPAGGASAVGSESRRRKSMGASGSKLSSHGSKMSESTLHQQRNDAAKRMQADIAKKTVSTLVVNIRHLHSTIGSTDQLRTLHKTIIGAVNVTVKAVRGVLDGVVGDRARCSWNAARPMARHKSSAANFSAAIQREAVKVGGTISIGAACGDVLAGSMGCDGVRFFALIGKCVSFAHVLERFGAADSSTESVCVMDNGIKEESRMEMLYRWMAVVIYKKKDSKAASIWQLVSAREKEGEDEWMYQLESAEAKDPWAAYNSAAALFQAGKDSEAMEALSKGAEQAPEVAAKYADLREGRIVNKTQILSECGHQLVSDAAVSDV